MTSKEKLLNISKDIDKLIGEYSQEFQIYEQSIENIFFKPSLDTHNTIIRKLKEASFWIKQQI